MPVEHGLHVTKRLCAGVLTNAVVLRDIGTSLRDIHGHDLFGEQSILPGPCGIPVRTDCKRILVLPSDSKRGILRDVFRGESHDEVAHGIGEARYQSDTRRIALEIKEYWDESHETGSAFAKRSGFPILKEQIGDSAVVREGNSAHRLHAERQHRVRITASDTQARIVQG